MVASPILLIRGLMLVQQTHLAQTLESCYSWLQLREPGRGPWKRYTSISSLQEDYGPPRVFRTSLCITAVGRVVNVGSK